MWRLLTDRDRILPDWIDLLQLLLKHFLDLSLSSGKEKFFFFFLARQKNMQMLDAMDVENKNARQK